MSDQNLDTAAAIGRRLAREAIWHEGICNWVGASPEAGPGGSLAISYAALGPDLYGGTSGVALFLAELYLATGEEQLRRTALGALRQALVGARRLSAPVRPALYAGGVGVALAAARVDSLLGEPRSAADVAELAAVQPAVAVERDLMSGDAGAVIGLLALAQLTPEDGDSLRTRAFDFGQHLLASATKGRDTMSWPSYSLPGRPHLTGLSHGASGCALALLELWHYSGERDYLHAAEGALAYERSLFDPDAANWPDLRGAHEEPSRRSFATLWCHGSGGIALCRLRAIELDTSGPVRTEARTALDTTASAVAAELAHGGNFSLCHGLAGNAETLLHGVSTLGPERATDATLAERVANEGIERYACAPGGWPCGTFAGETPGLFLGLAGIGRFYLRLHEPRLPSLLAPCPRELGATPTPAAAGR